MKTKLILCIILTPFFVLGQSFDLVYAEQLDSNEYIGNLEYINQQLFFEKGRYLSMPGAYCSVGEPRYVPENSIYTIQNNQLTPFILSHLDKSKTESLHKIDSANLLSRYEYFNCTDTSGIFLPIRLSSHYWLMVNDSLSKIHLDSSWQISSYYPRWFNEKLLVFLRTQKHSGQLFYFNKTDLNLQPFIATPYTFRAHNPESYDSLLIFNTYDPDSKDHQLYSADYEGNLHRITYYPRGLFHFNQEALIDSILFLRLQDKGIPDNYDYKKFGPTSFWKYNFNTRVLHEIKEMPTYGITNNSSELANRFITLYGYHEYSIYREDPNGKLQNISANIPTIKHCLARSTQVSHYFFVVGVDKHDAHRILVVDGKNDEIALSESMDNILSLRPLDTMVILLTKDTVQKKNAIKIVSQKGEIKSIKGLSQLEGINFIEILTYNDIPYLLLVQKGYSQLYRLDLVHFSSEMILDHIVSFNSLSNKINSRKRANYLVTKEGIYFICKNRDNKGTVEILKLN